MPVRSFFWFLHSELDIETPAMTRNYEDDDRPEGTHLWGAKLEQECRTKSKRKKKNLYPAHTQIFFLSEARAASSRLRSGIDFRSSITHWEVEGITFWVLTWLFCLTHIVSGAAVQGCFHEGGNPFQQDGIWRSQLSSLLTARCFESK